MNCPIWFDIWTKQAEARRARRRRVEELLTLIGSTLMVVGLLMTTIGVLWIDSMDVTAGNVILSFVGVMTAGAGTWIRFQLEVRR